MTKICQCTDLNQYAPRINDRTQLQKGQFDWLPPRLAAQLPTQTPPSPSVLSEHTIIVFTIVGFPENVF